MAFISAAWHGAPVLSARTLRFGGSGFQPRPDCGPAQRGLPRPTDSKEAFPMSQEKFNKGFVLLLLLFITAVFLAMILPFLMTILMAAIFSGLAWPLYRRLRRGFGRRSSPAALVTLLVILIAVILPLAALLGAVTGEAIKVSQTVKPWIQRQIAEPAAFSEWLEAIPFYDRILPYKETIFQKAGEMVGRLSSYLINSLSSVTVMTAQFIFLLFIFFYTMFFFPGGRRAHFEQNSLITCR
jgi:predicted PurR-regulated permease PerM